MKSYFVFTLQDMGEPILIFFSDNTLNINEHNVCPYNALLPLLVRDHRLCVKFARLGTETCPIYLSELVLPYLKICFYLV